MSTSDPIFVPHPTPYAIKYGNVQTRGGRTTNRSAFSPILPALPALDFGHGDFANFLEQGRKFRFDQNREAQQRTAFYDFTTRELFELDCISTRKLLEANLTNPVLPFLEDENWETKRYDEADMIAFWPIDENDPSLGDWILANPRVKVHVQQSIQAASRLLVSPDMLAFLEELVLAEVYPVSLDRIPPEHHDLQSRKGKELLLQAIPKQNITLAERAEARRHLEIIFATMKERLTLGFYAGDRDPHSGDPIDYGSYGLTFFTQSMELGGKFGVPYTDPKATKFWAYFDFVNLISPLMRDDLLHSERLGIQWFLTIVIVHELMHAIWKTHFWLMSPARCVDGILGDVPEEGDTSWEVYWDQCPVSELGHHMEHVVFGGQAEPFLLDRPGGPLGYFMGQVYPTVMDSGQGYVLTSPSRFTTQIFWPLPVRHFERIFQEQFWNVGIASFGLEVMNTKYLSHGSRVDYTQTEEALRTGPEDIWKSNPAFKIYRNDFTPQTTGLHAGVAQLNQKYALLALTPREIIAKVWGEHMVESAKLHTAYHDTVHKMNVKIQEMHNATQGGEYLVQGPAQQRWAQSVADSLDKAITAHVHAYRDLLTVEKQNHTTYPDWRSSLHSWNAEVRKFLFQIIKARSNHQDVNILNSLAERLEVARMGLYDNGPGDLENGTGNLSGRDQEEWTLAFRLNNTLAQLDSNHSPENLAQYLSERRQLLERSDPTILVRSLIDLLDGSLPGNFQPKQERLKSLNASLQTLTSLSAQVSQAWRAFLDLFISQARQTLASVTAETDTPAAATAGAST
ncbi:hypothetical protein BP5796_05141 [Coleophoma crateriformis]|uniref:Uncharacterized protein n=1 Tax=Coleophoma crateriformis TaxID=565419 RepID=A0A3D8S2B5_9HELO|nr:hypothetical protein BP5796_05141 [Coleophoma crateriformis]